MTAYLRQDSDTSRQRTRPKDSPASSLNRTHHETPTFGGSVPVPGFGTLGQRPARDTPASMQPSRTGPSQRSCHSPPCARLDQAAPYYMFPAEMEALLPSRFGRGGEEGKTAYQLQKKMHRGPSAWPRPGWRTLVMPARDIGIVTRTLPQAAPSPGRTPLVRPPDTQGHGRLGSARPRPALPRLVSARPGCPNTGIKTHALPHTAAAPGLAPPKRERRREKQHVYSSRKMHRGAIAPYWTIIDWIGHGCSGRKGT